MSDPLQRLTTALADRYAIERELGSGGMATVYLAEDLKHKRKVAVKVLRPELSAILGSERFLKEIEVTANLQHPNILPLYDSGEANSFLYYVMPFMEGESLRDKLTREKQLGMDETVEIAKDVAGALHYAHEHGVVHRDIKPENILLQSGQPLVADFGIALAVSHAGGTRLTETGLSLGTPQYMSPEQATGDRELDARSDVYSLGCVIYEMLVGDPPHLGGSAQAVIAKILSAQPTPMSHSRHTIPPHVDAAVLTALSKTPADRFASAIQFAEALTNPAFSMPTVSGQATSIRSTGRWNTLTTTFAVVALVFFATTVWSWLRPESQTGSLEPARRFDINLPAEAPVSLQSAALSIQNLSSLAISPDGMRLVYVAATPDGSQLYARSLDGFEASPLPGTEGAIQPFFSPDGEAIGFFAAGQLWTLSLSAEAPIPLAEVRQPRGASWGESGRILVAEHHGLRLTWINAKDGRKQDFASDCGTAFEDYCATPEILPGEEWALVWGWMHVAVVSLESGERRRILEGVPLPNPKLVGRDYLVYTAEPGRLFVQRFDLDVASTVGSAIPALEGVRREVSGAGQLAASRNGTLVYVEGASAAQTRLTWVDRTGRETPLPYPDGVEVYEQFRLSPDGSQLAATVTRTDQNIWVYDLVGRRSTQITQGGLNQLAVWSPDGQRLAFGSRGRGESIRAVRMMVLDLASGEQTPRVDDASPSEWTQDGSILFGRLQEHDGREFWDIWAIPDSGGEAHSLLDGPYIHDSPRVSPNGLWIAYSSEETGRFEIWVEPYPPTGNRRKVSSEGGIEPLWSPDGSELFYRSGTEVWSVAVTYDPFELGTPRVLFDGSFLGLTIFTFDISPDGRRFLLGKPARPQTTAASIRVVTNWTSELQEKLGRR